MSQLTAQYAIGRLMVRRPAVTKSQSMAERGTR